MGGGPTGVETVGAMAELYRNGFSKDYPAIPQEHARLTLVEAGPTLFAMFKQNLRDYTVQALEKRDVEVVVGEIVSSVEPTRVTLKSGKVLTRTRSSGVRAFRPIRSWTRSASIWRRGTVSR